MDGRKGMGNAKVRQDISFDEFDAARKFVLSLKLKTIRQRFASVQDWNPHHCALVYLDGRPVALADCMVTGDRAAAICGLIAKPGFGAFALRALFALKRHTALGYWVATVRTPSNSVIAIGRCHLDELYDQGAWEISNEIMQRIGPSPTLSPIPLVLSRSMLRNLKLPPISHWSDRTKLQVLDAAIAPGSANLIAPSGDALGQLLVTAAFEVAGIPFDVRQNMVRMIMVSTAAMHWRSPSPIALRKLLSQSAIADFQHGVLSARSSLRTGGSALFLNG